GRWHPGQERRVDHPVVGLVEAALGGSPRSARERSGRTRGGGRSSRAGVRVRPPSKAASPAGPAAPSKVSLTKDGGSPGVLTTGRGGRRSELLAAELDARAAGVAAHEDVDRGGAAEVDLTGLDRAPTARPAVP